MGRDHSVECEKHPGEFYSGFNGPDRCPCCAPSMKERQPMNEPERYRQAFCECGKPTGEAAGNCLSPHSGPGHSTVHDRWLVPEAELTALREGLEQIAAQECFYAPGSCSPPVRCPTCIARQALSGDEAKPERLREADRPPHDPPRNREGRTDGH